MPPTAAIIDAVSHWLNYLFAIPMVILGTIGALLTILVFTRNYSFRSNSTTVYLLAGAIMSVIHLPSIYLQSILVDGFDLGIFNTNEIACREHSYLLYVTTLPVISFTCWAAFDQYVATCHEATFRNRWSSMEFARFAIFCTIIFWTLVYIPIIVISSSIDGICILTDGVVKKIYAYFLNPLAYSVGPLIIVVILTWGTIRNLQSIKFVNRHNRLTNQIRRMIVPQLFVLIISGIPFVIMNIYDDLTIKMKKSVLRLTIEHLSVQITRLLYHCNFVCPFYIYFYMSRCVRKVLKRCAFDLIGINRARTKGALNA